MAEQEPKVFKVCIDGPKCSQKYLLFGQGTGDLCKDIDEEAKKQGVNAKAVPSDCLDHCPLPWERSSVIGPDGKLHRTYFEDIPALIKLFG